MLSTNNQTVDEEISEADSLIQILYWIGFTTENQRNHLITDSYIIRKNENPDHEGTYEDFTLHPHF